MQNRILTREQVVGYGLSLKETNKNPVPQTELLWVITPAKLAIYQKKNTFSPQRIWSEDIYPWEI